jgi:hypothetical protein
MKKAEEIITLVLITIFLFFLYEIKENAIKESLTKRPFDEWTKEDFENSTIYNGSCTDTITYIDHKGDTIIELHYPGK